LVDVHIANLRKKIEVEPANPRYVQTVRGVGYRFRGP
jgi:two-component system alkaline phosphatase synthesis response regulator PhoP